MGINNKNIEPHFGSNVKNFFIAQIMGDFLMFLSSFLEAQITKVGAKNKGEYGFFGQILQFLANIFYFLQENFCSSVLKNIKAGFPQKFKNMKICSNLENLRTIEAKKNLLILIKKVCVLLGSQK